MTENLPALATSLSAQLESVREVVTTGDIEGLIITPKGDKLDLETADHVVESLSRADTFMVAAAKFAFVNRIWETYGLQSWQAFVDKKLPHLQDLGRRAQYDVVKALCGTEGNMSASAAADLLGVSPGTVSYIKSKIKAAEPDFEWSSTPIGKDGKAQSSKPRNPNGRNGSGERPSKPKPELVERDTSSVPGYMQHEPTHAVPVAVMIDYPEIADSDSKVAQMSGTTTKSVRAARETFQRHGGALAVGVRHPALDLATALTSLRDAHGKDDIDVRRLDAVYLEALRDAQAMIGEFLTWRASLGDLDLEVVDAEVVGTDDDADDDPDDSE